MKKCEETNFSMFLVTLVQAHKALSKVFCSLNQRFHSFLTTSGQNMPPINYDLRGSANLNSPKTSTVKISIKMGGPSYRNHRFYMIISLKMKKSQPK